MKLVLAAAAATLAMLALRRRAAAGDGVPVVEWGADGVRHKCGSCREWHVGLPRWVFAAPDHVLEIPEPERAARAVREEDAYLLDDRWFFTMALLDVPVHGLASSFGWGVWVNLRRADAARFVTLNNDAGRAGGEAFEGRLANALPGYPATRTLAVRLRVRPWPERPQVEVLDEEHPLARHQRDGISQEHARTLLAGLFPSPRPAAPHPTRAAAAATRA